MERLLHKIKPPWIYGKVSTHHNNSQFHLSCLYKINFLTKISTVTTYIICQKIIPKLRGISWVHIIFSFRILYLVYPAQSSGKAAASLSWPTHACLALASEFIIWYNTLQWKVAFVREYVLAQVKILVLFSICLAHCHVWPKQLTKRTMWRKEWHVLEWDSEPSPTIATTSPRCSLSRSPPYQF